MGGVGIPSGGQPGRGCPQNGYQPKGSLKHTQHSEPRVERHTHHKVRGPGGSLAVLVGDGGGAPGLRGLAANAAHTWGIGCGQQGALLFNGPACDSRSRPHAHACGQRVIQGSVYRAPSHSHPLAGHSQATPGAHPFAPPPSPFPEVGGLCAGWGWKGHICRGGLQPLCRRCLVASRVDACMPGREGDGRGRQQHGGNGRASSDGRHRFRR